VKARATRRAWQLARCRREQGTISGAKPRPRDLAAQNLELVAERHQLDVFDVRATTAANKQAEQSPNSEVEQREEHATDPRSPHPETTRPE